MACSVKYCNFCNEKLKERIVIKRVQLLINVVQEKKKKKKTPCSWYCTVMDFEFSEEMKTTIAKKKMIRLVVKYEKRVTERCVNQTSRDSSGNITEHWQIWLPRKKLSVFTRALASAANLMFYMDSNGDREEVRVICTLKPVNTTAKKSTNDGGSFPIFSRSHLADLGVKFDSIDCNTETTDNLQSCINITKSSESSENKSPKFIDPGERGGWPSQILICFCYIFGQFSYIIPQPFFVFSRRRRSLSMEFVRLF